MNSAIRQTAAPLSRQIGTMVAEETFAQISEIADRREWSIAKTARDLIVKSLVSETASEPDGEKTAA